MNSLIKSHKAYQYAVQVVNNEIISGKFVKIQCQKFLDDVNDENCKYFIDENELQLITNLTKLINMSTGLRVGIPAHDALAGFQWFFLVNALCWKHKNNPVKRRYEKSVLLIARKSGKLLAPCNRNVTRKTSKIGESVQVVSIQNKGVLY